MKSASWLAPRHSELDLPGERDVDDWTQVMRADSDPMPFAAGEVRLTAPELRLLGDTAAAEELEYREQRFGVRPLALSFIRRPVDAFIPGPVPIKA